MENQALREVKKYLGSSDPLIILKKWLKKAQEGKVLSEPWVMHLSTSISNKPSSRIILLKEVKKGGLIFFTNYNSRKGKEMQKNPYVACTFYWNHLDRQICIRGSSKKTTRKENLSYWKKRNRESQLSQWLSKQSDGVENRKDLEEAKIKAREKFKNKIIPCPAHWGGYFLSISEIEFWQGRQHRLHDRFLFKKKKEKWKFQRLFP